MFLSVASGREAVAFRPEEIRERRSVEIDLGGDTLAIEGDARLEAPRAWAGALPDRRERAVVPMYWFALDRHFDTIRGLTAP